LVRKIFRKETIYKNYANQYYNPVVAKQAQAAMISQAAQVHYYFS